MIRCSFNNSLWIDVQRAAGIDNRGETRDFHVVAAAQAGIEKTGGKQRVSHRVSGIDVVFVTGGDVHIGAAVSGMMPAAKVPFVKGDVNAPS